MELRQLIYFREIVDAGGYSKASKNLKVTQSALTHSIQSLESELGVKLFERSKNSIVLNEAGSYVLSFANKIIDLSDELHHGVQKFYDNVSAFRMATSAQNILNGIIPYAYSTDKSIRLYYEKKTNADCERSLIAGNVDIIVTTRVMDDERIGSFEIANETIVLVIPDANDPLASKKSVSVKDLEGRELLLYADTPIGCNTEAILDAIKRENVNVSIITQSDYQVYDQMAESGNFLYNSSTASIHIMGEMARNVVVPFSDPNLTKVRYYISYLKENREELSPVIDLFKRRYRAGAV